MSSIQQGIQAAHCQMELFNKYKEIDLYDYAYSTSGNPPEDIIIRANLADQLFNWSKNHKTMICLSAGNNTQLTEIKELFEHDNKYPWSHFNEDEESLGGILTNVCIVLPPEIYETASKIRSGEYTISVTKVWDENDKFVMVLTDFNIRLIKILNSCQLAR